MSAHHNILKLRPYQARGLNQLIAKLNSPDAAALLVGPTGCGKTEIMAALIDRLPRRARTIVLQDLVDLVRQNGARIANYLRDRTVVTMAASLPQKFHLPGDATTADVVVGTIETILASIEYIGAVDMLVIDEAQHAPARSYLECIDKLRALNPELRIMGATATPERPDFVGLHCVFGDEAASVITLKELIEGGWLVPPRVLALPLAGLAKLIAQKIPDDDDERLSAALNLEVVHQEVIRNWARYGEQRQSVFFCQDVAHSDGLAAAFRDTGVEAESVSYKTPIRKRTTLIRDFAAGQGVKVLTNPLLLCEGFDAPPVSCIGLVRWIVSKSPLIQPVGRGLRLYSGKQDCLVLDFLATVERVGDLTAGINLRGRKAPPPIHGGDPTGEGRGLSTIIGYGEVALQPFAVPNIPDVSFIRLPENVPPSPEKKRELVDGKEVISRPEALAKGLRRYFTGKPCSKGHVAERSTRYAQCVECTNELSKQQRGDAEYQAWLREYLKDPKVRARQSKHLRERMNDPERLARKREKAREAHRERMRDPEHRAKVLERRRERVRELVKDPEYVARKREKARERYARDPVYRASIRVEGAKRKVKRLAERLKALASITCEICDQPTPPEGRANRRYCSVACRLAAADRRRREALQARRPPPMTEEDRKRLETERQAKEKERARERRQTPQFRAREAERRRERMKDPDYRVRLSEQCRKRRMKNPEKYKARAAERLRKLQQDPERRAEYLEYHRKRRQDPAYREYMREYLKAWAHAKKNDPEYQAKMREARHAYKARKKEAEPDPDPEPAA